MNINIHNQTNLNINKYKKVLELLFSNIENENTMEIIFVTKNQIKELNKYYRNKDTYTDVLSFPNDDEEFNSLGDIFICIEVAINQAKEYKHSEIREISFLAVHGYLHLLGYDHETEEEEKEMIKLQEEILNKANIKRE